MHHKCHWYHGKYLLWGCLTPCHFPYGWNVFQFTIISFYLFAVCIQLWTTDPIKLFQASLAVSLVGGVWGIRIHVEWMRMALFTTTTTKCTKKYINNFVVINEISPNPIRIVIIISRRSSSERKYIEERESERTTDRNRAKGVPSILFYLNINFF